MPPTTPNADERKMLPGGSSSPPATQPAPVSREITTAAVPSRQLSELPKDELEHLAEEFGLDPKDYKTRQHLVAAIHDRRQMIASFEREAMLDVVRWGRRPVLASSAREQLAQEIVRIKSMRFEGLTQAGLLILARLRGVRVGPQDDVPALVRKLKKQEGFFTRLNRKRRALLGSIVSNMLGEGDKGAAGAGGTEYQFLPPADATGGTTTAAGSASKAPSIRDEIEESGLFGGIAGRIKRSADEYLNQKLDEIEARIDRKLDEIDRRLGEWRDKEIANRIRILKITLWASVIVGAFSLIYSYVKELVSPTYQPTIIRDTRPATTSK
jgi:hypothetical protein